MTERHESSKVCVFENVYDSLICKSGVISKAKKFVINDTYLLKTMLTDRDARGFMMRRVESAIFGLAKYSDQRRGTYTSLGSISHSLTLCGLPYAQGDVVYISKRTDI